MNQEKWTKNVHSRTLRSLATVYTSEAYIERYSRHKVTIFWLLLAVSTLICIRQVASCAYAHNLLWKLFTEKWLFTRRTHHTHTHVILLMLLRVAELFCPNFGVCLHLLLLRCGKFNLCFNRHNWCSRDPKCLKWFIFTKCSNGIGWHNRVDSRNAEL